jgi:hypothetical protein
MEDPIVEEVRKLRDQHAARFQYDLDAIFGDFKRLERENGWQLVSLEPKRPLHATAGKRAPKSSL